MSNQILRLVQINTHNQIHLWNIKTNENVYNHHFSFLLIQNPNYKSIKMMIRIQKVKQSKWLNTLMEVLASLYGVQIYNIGNIKYFIQMNKVQEFIKCCNI